MIKGGQRIEQARTLVNKCQAPATAYGDAIYDFLKLVRYNVMFLTASFFPRYPKDQPLSFASWPHVCPMFHFQVGGFLVIKGSRQIGKSTIFSVRQLLMARLIPGFRSLYLAPRPDQLKTYADKLMQLEHVLQGARREKNQRSNLYYKEFSSRSIVELAYVLTNADRIRGKSTDEILYDEFQNFDADLEIEVAQTQSASPMKVTLYAGTSLTTDSALEHKFQQSSQASWCMKCGCGHWNIPLKEHGVLDMIQPDGPACVRCGRPLVIEHGEWVHANRQMLELDQPGFTVPQIISPERVHSPVAWAEIYQGKVRSGGNRKFLGEILAIASEEGEREITRQQLMDMCQLGPVVGLEDKAANRQYRLVISGCDWGGADPSTQLHIKVSTTVHAMIGVTGTGHFDLIHFRRYWGMDYDDITHSIIANHQRLNGNAIASDVGVGAVYNSELRRHLPPERHLMFRYYGPDGPLVRTPKTEHSFNEWLLNKTDSISRTYEMVRNGRLRCFQWDQSEEYLQDFLNLYRAPSEKPQTGRTLMIYRPHPTKPNDALMAANYAIILAQIMLGEPMFADAGVQLSLERTLRSGIGHHGYGTADDYVANGQTFGYSG